MANWSTRIRSRGKSGKKLGIGCFALFLLPFCLVSIFLIVEAVRTFAEGDWKKGSLTLLGGLVFGGFGFGLQALLFYARKDEKKTAARRAQLANQPWLWREDWAKKEIRHSHRGSAIGMWLFALFWNAIASGVFFLIPREIERGNKWVLLALIFPAVGLALFAHAFRLTRQWRRYGESVFRLLDAQITRGGYLNGLIETSAKLPFNPGILLTLACIERDTSGESVSEKTLWDDEKRIVRDFYESDRDRSGIPVHFDIPRDTIDSSPDTSGSKHIVWRLRAESKAPGINYSALFEIPVFGEAPSSETRPHNPLAQFEAARESFDQQQSRLRLTPLGTRGLEIYSPSGRTGMHFGLALFVLLWWCGVGALWQFNAPIVFPIFLALFGLLFTWVWIEMALISTTATIEHQTATIKRALLGFRWSKQLNIPPDAKAALDTSFEAGKVKYYDVVLKWNENKKFPLVKFVRNRAEANHVLAEIQKYL